MCKHIKAVWRMRDGVVMAREAITTHVIGKNVRWDDPYLEELARLENFFEYKANKLEMDAEKQGLRYNKCLVCKREFTLTRSNRKKSYIVFLEIVAIESKAYGIKWNAEAEAFEEPLFTDSEQD